MPWVSDISGSYALMTHAFAHALIVASATLSLAVAMSNGVFRSQFMTVYAMRFSLCFKREITIVFLVPL
jgi:hypothetical protein